MAIWYEGNLNIEGNRREFEGHVYFVRGTSIVDGVVYERYGIQTPFVEVGEDYMTLIKQYVVPLYKSGDLLSISEKVIAMCQGEVVEKSRVKVGFWARFLSQFALKTKSGVGMDEPYKLQLAINMKGLPLILWASFCSGIGKLFKKRGIFYQIVGKEVAGMDGFYSHSAFERYHNLAVLSPKEPMAVCQSIYETYGIRCMLVDANDIDIDLLGYSNNFTQADHTYLKEVIRDNPAGQDDECTPFVLIHPLEAAE